MNSAQMSNRTPESDVDNRIWIFGGGKFGSQAANTLITKTPEAHITLVDKKRLTALPGDINFVRCDALDWLIEHVATDTAGVKIIPAVPIHLAARWLCRKFLLDGFRITPLEIPVELLMRLPNPFQLAENCVAVSHADFLCPPDCTAPDRVCTHTGLPRPEPLYELLHHRSRSYFTPLILTSLQFGRGVGGYYAGDLQKIYKTATSLATRPLLIGTACKCHGVIDGLVLEPAV